jgi:ABC-2 type transport system permease protein
VSSQPLVEIGGPSAIAGDWRRLYDLSRILALADFKLRFFDSALGYLWTLIRPLGLFGILYFVFSQVIELGDTIDHYPVVLLTGILMFSFFSDATSQAVTALVDHENLIRKVRFPRAAVPASILIIAAINLALNSVVILGFLLASGIEPTWTWLEVPVIIAFLVVFTFGMSLTVAALYVPARDVKPIWEVTLQGLFYATPILYPIELLRDHSETLAKVAMVNPLATVIQQLRRAVIDPAAPSAAAALGGRAWLMLPLAVCLGSLALGLWSFNRMVPRMAEEL